ncbi:MAG: hypothetical protein F6K10_05440 [Moorea sp. SIO2B7]|nr:hypothetical protein [Moorena sp. SIO2B7]
MELATLSAAAIATLVITKAFEKAGEELGEKAVSQSGKLVQLLRDKFPNTASVVEQTELPPLDLGEVHLDETVAQELERAASSEDEVKAAVQTLAQTVTNQVMVRNIKVKGSLEVGNMIQKGKPEVLTNQTMLEKMDVGVDAKLGNLTQYG